MVDVVLVERKSPVLRPSKLACLGRMPTINLTAGCAHGCLYCYTQGYGSYPGRGRVLLYANLLDKLRAELARKRKRPRVVCFSPSSDLFQPLPQLLDLALDVLELLLRSGIGVVFLTKGKIPKRHMELLIAHAPLVRATIGVVTLDRRVQRLLEPWAASPATRIEQMRRLVAGGVATQARLDPIVPGVTDDPDTMHALCAALAEAGVREISASTLFLRPAIVGALREQLQKSRTRARILQAFTYGKWLKILSGQGSVLALPAARRRRIFDWLTAIAGHHGITVHVCGCKNPDMTSDSCGLAGPWLPPAVIERQLALFGSP